MATFAFTPGPIGSPNQAAYTQALTNWQNRNSGQAFNSSAGGGQGQMRDAWRAQTPNWQELRSRAMNIRSQGGTPDQMRESWRAQTPNWQELRSRAMGIRSQFGNQGGSSSDSSQAALPSTDVVYATTPNINFDPNQKKLTDPRDLWRDTSDDRSAVTPSLEELLKRQRSGLGF